MAADFPIFYVTINVTVTVVLHAVPGQLALLTRANLTQPQIVILAEHHPAASRCGHTLCIRDLGGWSATLVLLVTRALLAGGRVHQKRLAPPGGVALVPELVLAGYPMCRERCVLQSMREIGRHEGGSLREAALQVERPRLARSGCLIDSGGRPRQTCDEHQQAHRNRLQRAAHD